MATYKVIQNVEAEDKILGPLTLRQFIYAGVTAICLYLTYFVSTHGGAFMAIVFLPIAFVTGFFAIPWGRDQPTEVWALARIQFMLKPRRRIWNQSGVKELVTVTAPKRHQENYTNGLSENEVQSRLHALADTLDSRGWAVKNSDINMYTQPALIMNEPSQDRLVSATQLPQQTEPIDIHAADDMLDEQNNPAAQQMDNMIAASAKAHRQKIVDSLNQPNPTEDAAPKQPQQPRAPANDYWFLNQPAQSARIPEDMVTFNTQVVTPTAAAGQNNQNMGMPGAPVNDGPNEEELVEQLEARKQQLPMTAYYGHLHTIQPLSAQQAQAKAQADAAQSGQQPQNDQAFQQPAAPMQLPATDIPQPPMSQPPTLPQASGSAPDDDPFALPGMPSIQAMQQGTPADNTGAPQSQAQSDAQPVTPTQQAAILQLANNDDLNVATLAREAQRSGMPDGEVVIKLH